MKKNSLLPITLCLYFLVHSILFAQSSQRKNYLIVEGKHEKLQSVILGEDRDIWVYIPKSEGFIKSNSKYPVLYLLDGGVHFSSATAIIKQLGKGLIPDMIVVAIANNQNRTRDLTPSHISGPMNENSGGAEKFTRFLEDELIPYVDKKYPTTTYRTLVGHSHGGLFALNILADHPHLFNNYISIDPSLGWDNQLVYKKAISALKEEKLKDKSLFLAIANSLDTDTTIVLKDTANVDMIHTRSSLLFAKAATNNKKSGLNFNWKYYPDDNHFSVVLISMHDGLRTLFPWFRIREANEHLREDNSTKETVDFINKIYSVRSKHFGYKVVPEEDMLNGLGYSFLHTQQLDKAFAFFKMNIENYPESANVYDSMADYYIAQSDKEKALINLKKAFEISGSNYHKKRIKEVKAMTP